jgi:Rrf2 family protein
MDFLAGTSLSRLWIKKVHKVQLTFIMQLTRAADYAVRVMIHLAGLPPATRVRRAILAEATAVPESFMSKVLQALVRARLITSRRGVDGGFELISSAEQTSLLDVVEAIEGPIHLNFCLMAGDTCERHISCPAHAVWAEAQTAMTEVLKRASLAELAARTVSEVSDVSKGLINPAALDSGAANASST